MPEGIEEIQRVWEEADCIVSGEQVERAINQVAIAIERDMANSNPVVLCVMSGGLIFCAKLLMQLRFPLELDYIQVSRYRGEVEGGAIEWLVTPRMNLYGRDILIVDDILDEGETLLEIIRVCEQQGAEDIRSVVLVDKQHDRKVQSGIRADFTALDVEDRYLFGYGMDYKGYLRNATGIYAVKGL